MKLSIIAVAMTTLIVGCSEQVKSESVQQQEQIKQLQAEVKALKEAAKPVVKPKLILTQDDAGYEGSKAEKHFEEYYAQCQGNQDVYMVDGKGFLCSSYEITVDLIGQWKNGDFDQNLAKHQKSFDSYCKLGQGDLYSVTDKDGEQIFYCYNFSTAMGMIGEWQYESN